MTVATSDMGKSNIPWWLFLLEGIAAIILGFFLLTSPASTMVILVTFLGAYWLVSGILKLVSIFVDSHQWGWKLIGGILGILAGIVVLQHPLWSTALLPAILVILLGINGIILGIVELIQAFTGGGWGAAILGVLSIIFGLLLLGQPLITGLALPFVLGIFAVIGGIAAVFFAFKVR